jgi:hypothetical protein
MQPIACRTLQEVLQILSMEIFTFTRSLSDKGREVSRMLRNSSTNLITVTGLKNDVADISEKNNRKNNVNYCIKQIKQKTRYH